MPTTEKKRFGPRLLFLTFIVLLILPFWIIFFLILWVIEKLFGAKDKINRTHLKEICEEELARWENSPVEELLALEFPHIYSIPLEKAELQGELSLVNVSDSHSRLVLNIHGQGKGMSLTQNMFSVCAPVGRSFLVEKNSPANSLNDSEQ